MYDNQSLLQLFITHLTELIIDRYENAYTLIKKQGLKPNCATLNGLIQLQSNFRELKKNHRSGIILPLEWEQRSQQCIARIINCLSGLEEDELEENTLENFKQEKEENQNDTEGGQESIDFENLDDIEEKRFRKKRIVLEKIDITEIPIPENTDILTTPERCYEFKKRMTNIQDYLIFGTYGKALIECEYILKNLELQSGLLHEYHTISYFKAHGEEYGIMQDIQNQKEDTFKQLILCIKRTRLFRNKSKVSFEDNVEYICYRMSIILREFYRGTRNKHNYINQDDNPDLRNLISRYISTGLVLVKEIYQGELPITVFIEYALMELNGGGRLEWFDVTADWRIRNRDSFPALELRDDIIQILKQTNTWQVCRKRLSRNLAIKYSSIKISNRKNSSTIESRRAFRRFFKASVIGYKCFEDTSFLELFKDELLHLGELSWFDLNESGKLVANEECKNLNYDPMKDLVRLQPLFNSSDFQTSVGALISELKRQKEIKIINDHVQETDRKYDELRRTMIKPDIYFRKQVTACIQEWEKAFEKANSEDFINRAIKELIGKNSLLFWFQLDEKAELVNHVDTKDLVGFDAKQNLDNWLSKSPNYYQNKDAIWKEIRLKAAEIMEQEANVKYYNSNL